MSVPAAEECCKWVQSFEWRYFDDLWWRNTCTLTSEGKLLLVGHIWWVEKQSASELRPTLFSCSCDIQSARQGNALERWQFCRHTSLAVATGIDGRRTAVKREDSASAWRPLVSSRLSLPFRCGTVCPLTMMWCHDGVHLPHHHNYVQTRASASALIREESTTSWPSRRHDRLLSSVGESHFTESISFMWRKLLQIVSPSRHSPPLIESIAQLGHCFSWHCLFATISSHVGRVAQCQCITMSQSECVYVCMASFGRCHLESIIIKVGTQCWDTLEGFEASNCLPLPHLLACSSGMPGICNRKGINARINIWNWNDNIWKVCTEFTSRTAMTTSPHFLFPLPATISATENSARISSWFAGKRFSGFDNGAKLPAYNWN